MKDGYHPSKNQHILQYQKTHNLNMSLLKGGMMIVLLSNDNAIRGIHYTTNQRRGGSGWIGLNINPWNKIGALINATIK
jgi:hypothetical protein